VKEARQEIAAAAQKPGGKVVNNWILTYDLGSYGTNYLYRAAVASVGLGANLPEDAIYPVTRVDADGQPLTGQNKYVMHFTKDQIPPVNAFWSLTLYNNKQFFVENPINRYAIGDRDKLTFNADGSLDLYIQHETPGKDKESNWLPAPKDGFNLIMRLYWPRKPVLDGAPGPRLRCNWVSELQRAPGQGREGKRALAPRFLGFLPREISEIPEGFCHGPQTPPRELTLLIALKAAKRGSFLQIKEIWQKTYTKYGIEKALEPEGRYDGANKLSENPLSRTSIGSGHGNWSSRSSVS
jgi:hypothetical protein